jgi:hypothetical protein
LPERKKRCAREKTNGPKEKGKGAKEKRNAGKKKSLGERKSHTNIIVGGTANADPVLTLSQWRGSRTPDELREECFFKSLELALRSGAVGWNLYMQEFGQRH